MNHHLLFSNHSFRKVMSYVMMLCLVASFLPPLQASADEGSPLAIFSDDFESGQAANWTTYASNDNRGQWSVNAAKQYTIDGVPGAKTIAQGTSFKDLVYEADFQVKGYNSDSTGVLFRVGDKVTGNVSDGYTGYYASISIDKQVRLGRVTGENGDVWKELAVHPIASTSGHMKVVAIDNHIQVYVNDMVTPQIDYIDNDGSQITSAGAIGLRTWWGTSTIDNIVVREYSDQAAAKPVFSAAEGIYSTPQSVTLSSATQGATIRYTTDGTQPNETSPVYTSPIRVASSTLIKAYAEYGGEMVSDTSSVFYIIGTAEEAVHDDFESANTVTWSTYRGNGNGAWSVSGGRYQVTDPRGDKSVVDAVYENFIAETDINPNNSGQDNGIIFRVSDPGDGADNMSGYYAGLHKDGTVIIGKMDSEANSGNGAWTQIRKDVFPNIKANADNHMKVVGIGNQYYVFVNGGLAVQFTDSSYTTGTVGLRPWNDNQSVSFDNFTVTRLSNVMETVSNPVFTPAGGTFTDSQQVTLTTATPGAAIHYTTDGSTPTNNSAVYSSPITLTDTATVKAYATKDGMLDSEIQSAVFTKAVSNPIGDFNDDFNDMNISNWTTYQGSWNANDGALHVNNGAGYKAVANGTDFANFTYESDISISGGTDSNNAGVIFRVSSPSNGADNLKGYYAGIAVNGLVQVGRFNNSWTELASIPYPISRNTTYRLKVEAKGSNIEVYVNDVHVVSVVDHTYTHGAIGVRTFLVNTTYDNMAVHDTGAADLPEYDWSWVRGAVFVPTNVVNEVQQWEEYDHDINDRELSYAHQYGINFVRVFLHNLLWEKDSAQLLGNLEDFLTLADKYGIKVEVVFFDDCWDDNPHLGPQLPPRYGAHNSRWMEAPGDAVKADYPNQKQKLKEYVQGVVNAHLNDSRVAFWDTYNEPSNGESGLMDQVTKQIMNDARMWIKETGSSIPVSATGGQFSGGPFSDFITWHPYESDYPTPFGVSKEILADETMNRLTQSVPGVVEHYGDKGIGFVMWELGIGRDNCRFPWGSDVTPLTYEPTVPFHGVVYPDGHPWDVNDVKALLKGTPGAFDTLPVYHVQYFGDEQWANPVKASITPRIDFDLGNERGTGSPDASAGIGEDHFSIRWTGTIQPAESGAHTIYADSDNIAKVWIGDALVVDKTSNSREEVSGIVNLTEGHMYAVKIEYAHAEGDSSLHVKWSASGLDKQAMLPVYSGKSVDSVSLPMSELSLKVDESKTLIPDFEPIDAANQQVTWASSNTAIASVDSHGVVTGVGQGTADITVTAVDTANGVKTAVVHVTVGASESFRNPIVPVGSDAGSADPSVVFKDGYYYYVKSDKDSAIQVAKAKRLQDIGTSPRVTVYTPPSGTMYSKELWAPELTYLDGKWYIYVAADDGNNNNHRMYVLESDTQDPQGTYTFKGKIADSTNKWAIDGTVLVKADNTKYFVWSGWEGDTNVRQNIYIAPMSNPWTISGPRVMISTPDQAWELNGTPNINEGPEVLSKDGKTFIVYSASGSWTDDYNLGMLTNTDGDVLNASSWTKSGPVFSKTASAFGPGHNSFTKSPDGTEDWIVYHADKNSGGSWGNRSVRAQKFTWNADGTPNFGTPAAYGESMKQPSGTPVVERYKYEAEAAVLGGAAAVANEDNASGGKVVGHLDQAGSDYVEFQANVEHAGTYTLIVMADNGSAGGAAAQQDVVVNGGTAQKIAYKNYGWNHMNPTSIDVTLQAGNNTIRLAANANFAQVDSIILERVNSDGAAPIESILLDKPSLTVTAGAAAELTAMLKPVASSNNDLIISSSNPSIATAAKTGSDSASGIVNLGIQALAVGTTTIKVQSAADASVYAECVVTVRGLPTEPDLTAYKVDRFDNAALGSDWSIFQESSSNWSLTKNPGFMTIHTTPTDVYQDNNSQNNVFLQDVAADSNFEIVTKVTAPIALNHQQAGLFVWQNADNFVKLAHVWVDGKTLETAYEINRTYQKPGNFAPHPGTDTVTLKIKKLGNVYTTYYWNGYEWIQAADPVTANLSNIKVGFFANNIVATNNPIDAKFDYFAVRTIQGGVDLDPATLTLHAGETGQLQNQGASGSDVVWTSDNTDIATVSSTGLVTAKAPGRTVIRAVTEYGDFSSQSIVTVLDDAPAPDTLYSTDFTGDAVSWSSYGGNWTVVDGQYHVNSGSGYKSVLNTPSFTDYSLEADVQIKSGEEAGVIFRASNPSIGANAFDGYYLGINAANQTSVLGKMANGSWTEIASRKLPIHLNQNYHFKLNVSGGHIQVYIDDNPLNVNAYPKFDLVDNTYLSTGQIGLRTWNAEATFDNVKVSSYQDSLTGPTYSNSVLPNVADPYVLYYQGTYYLYATTTNWNGTGQGFKVYTSPDLVHWTEQQQLALSKADSWGNDRFWAPEVREKDGVFYLYYAVEERLAVATSSSPLGPFVQDVKQPIHPNTPEIDAHVFTDDDGKRYMYFVRFNNDNEIWAAELNDDMKTIKEDTLKFMFKATQDWEHSQKQPVADINEGPFVIKHNGTYYLTYSGNHFESPDYGVGYATAPTPMGPWTKYAYNPIMKSNTIVPGAGHHSLVQSPDGKELFMVYHTHYQVGQTEPRKLAIDRVHFVPQESGPDAMEVWGPTITPQLMPSNQTDVAVESITVKAPNGVNEITSKGGTLQLAADVMPADATNKDVTWSIADGSAYATITSAGLVTAVANGSVTVKAQSVGNPAVSGTLILNISGQKKGSNGSGSSSGGGSSEPTGRAEGSMLILPEAMSDASGKVTVQIGASDFNQVIGADDARHVVIQVQVSGEVKDVNVKLTTAQLQAAKEKKVESITLDLGGVTLTIDPTHFADKQGGASELELSAVKVDKESLPAEAKALVGEHDVYDFFVNADGEKVTDFGANGIQVAMNHALQPGEGPNTVVVYYIKDNGEMELIKNTRYNEQTGQAEFTATHFSKYAAVTRTVDFHDMDEAAWAKASVQALAARDIVDGTGAHEFTPNQQVTRAQFLKMLMYAFDLTSEHASSTFSDVEKDAWYYSSVSAAQKLGIVQGKDDGTFGVNDAITREDMAVMAYRAAQAAGIDLAATVGTADTAGAGDFTDQSQIATGTSDFSDKSEIASYAVSSVAAMQKAGILSGKASGLFAPKDSASRAEAAKMIYGLYKLYLSK
ncbi:family 43 glycosylhydrolase [Paenibacillus hexagrammi]|uniref:Family 43 glycosylhydrolase n=1 Tax=Paenibacillus hexagrammi TaxID=2908839 RepID=A0ABY3SD47_9BACL|nr:family 43 glycosylhydrolase [Paenibacillus sp. YPD9-1]UJF31883.1 family 43 glycosylhydrolase [Paenibacillus sp. YPD9-1]